VLDLDVSAGWALAGLFVSSFLAATVLPGGSEAALFAFARAFPDATLEALSLATLGNTLGGMSSYLLGRMLRMRELPARAGWVRRHGSVVLLLSWVPVVGDALCVAAGWLRVGWVSSALWMATGKAARYAAVLGLAQVV
jgi:membrane protein YqaA with SNARE-associated domain